MATSISHSPEETVALGEAWGREAQAGWVLALSGDLGAGKTQLVRGLARGLDVPGRVQSPTFSLVNVYAGGRLTLFHLDLYRLETLEQILSAGLEEYFRPEGVTVIEWAERWFGGDGSVPSRADRTPSIEAPNPSAAAISTSALPSTSVTLPSWAPGHLMFTTRLRRARLDTLSDTQRRITYEDLGP